MRGLLVVIHYHRSTSGRLHSKNLVVLTVVVPLLLWPSVAITFQRCKGKSQLSNDLGIRYGLSKIFLSLRVKEYLAESAPQPSETSKIVRVMIYSNFTGRVANQAKVIDGVNGQFLSMDMAVNDYSRDAS